MGEESHLGASQDEYKPEVKRSFSGRKEHSAVLQLGELGCCGWLEIGRDGLYSGGWSKNSSFKYSGLKKKKIWAVVRASQGLESYIVCVLPPDLAG